MGKYDVQAIRDKLRQQMSGRFNDPDEFKPEKAQDASEPIKYRFYVLPPLFKGEKCKSGTATRDMPSFFLQFGQHWINNKPYSCPRVWEAADDECPICRFGFDLMKGESNKEARRKIIDQWMPTTYYMVNIFFPNVKANPEDLRNKVKYYKAPKTCLDLWNAAIMRDDAGDKDDPNAFGVFYDEEAAFLFQLEVVKQGLNNSYKTSKFLANAGKPQPIVTLDDGSPNKKAIEAVLSHRIDLFTKTEEPDMKVINKVASILIDGNDDDDGFTDEDSVESGGGGSDDAGSDDLSDEQMVEDKEEPKEEVKEEKEEPKAKEEPKSDESDDSGDGDDGENLQDILDALNSES